MGNDINLGKDWEIVGNDGGNLVIKDKQNGNTYTLKPDGEIGASSVNADSVATGELSPTEKTDVPQSVYAAVSKGYVVALHPDSATKVIDPAAATNDASALQAANDYLAGKSTPAGVVFVPAIKSDGSAWSISSTVSWGDKSNNARVNPVGVGFSKSHTIGTTITNGDPVFEFVGDSTSRRGMRSTGFAFDFGGNDATVCRIERVNEWRIHWHSAINFAGTGWEIDGLCAEWQLQCNRVAPSNTSATCVDLVNTVGDAVSTADGRIGPDWQQGNQCGVGLSGDADAEKVVIGGKWEKARGRAQLDLAAGGPYIVTDECVLASDNGGTGVDAVRFDGSALVFNASKMDGYSGNGLNVVSAEELYVSPNTEIINTMGGDAYVIADPSTHGVVPREEALVGQTVFTTTFPSPPWGRLYTPEGWRLYREGTVTVSSGGSAAASNFAGRDGVPIVVEHWIANDPNADVEYEMRRGWNDGGGQTSVTFHELSSAGDVDIGYRIWRQS
jgi:hypothetical protein